VQNSRYDAYGEKTGGTGDVANKYLFAGEQYDSNLDDYYLRARYYDANSGRFTRRDTYNGDSSYPLTLNKYIYANGNPITWTDPTGLFSRNDGYAVEAAVEIAYATERPIEYPFTTFGRKARSRFGTSVNPIQWIKPDILNFKGLVPGAMKGKQAGVGLFNEIKPLSPSGVAAGTAQILGYFLALEQFGFIPDVVWHTPANPLTLSKVPIGGNKTNMFVFNIGGILFYTDDTSSKMRKELRQMVYTSFSEAIEKTKNLLLVGSNSAINELGRSKYLIESATNSLSYINYGLFAAMVATAAVLSRYAF
jgi:RHS repeat-associated protein